MEEKEMILEMYNKYSEQIPAQFSRRQTDNRYFLGICLAILASLGWLSEKSILKELSFVGPLACLLGLLICISWAITLIMYDKSIESKREVLKAIEDKLSSDPFYGREEEFEKEKLPCRFGLKLLRHYLPILGFAFVFIFSWCKLP